MSRFYLSKSNQIRSNVNDSHPYNIIIKDMEKNKYSKEPKTALVRPIFKKNENNTIRNYRPVSILNGMSKIYERCIHNSLSSYAETILSNFISAYKKSYSSNHVLLKLIENWKKSRDNKNFVGTVLMGLSKSFDCIPHDSTFSWIWFFRGCSNFCAFILKT